MNARRYRIDKYLGREMIFDILLSVQSKGMCKTAAD